MKWTLKEVQRRLDAGTIKGFKISSPSKDPQQKQRAGKYNNQKVKYNGILFDSKRECTRYRTLELLAKAGEIRSLRLQVPFELNAGGSHSYKYIADFVYTEVATGLEIVEDCKGVRTTVYKKKCRLMKKIFNITIRET